MKLGPYELGTGGGMMKAKDIYEVIDREILWCMEHPDKRLSADYRKGFTNGLIQAKYLIQQVAGIERKIVKETLR